MKKFKLVFLLFLLVIFTGCTGEYSVNIKSNGKVEEKFDMYFDASEVSSNSVSSLIDDTLKTYRENGMYIEYKVTKNVTKGSSVITAKKTYKSLEDYINNSELLPVLFDKTLYIDDYGIKGLQTVGEYFYDALFEAGDVDENPQFDKIDVKIHSQFNILESNATEEDKENNTLYWKLDTENKQNSIYFKYDNSKRYDIIIKDYLKENWFSIVVLVAIVIATLVVIKYIRTQDRQNNKI